ncbi:exodeoxyribonuclease V subunit alpha [Neisseria sp. Marseille-Q5346]|uniref:exodeoxyribonuclease V subunit alpha n=1 Tax=Neisseria sp. Marseille-Q5346 TaxID=2972775 RepID=UPI0021E0037F|nr:exodeoxyribonuclease V subunit alpha [Neisseria sp. Marseille-Q5346]
MNPTDSILSSAADAAIAFFRRHEVQGASVIEPYVVRLFAALQNGHSFIYLDKADVDALSNLPNLVGNADKPLILQGRKLFLGRMWQLEHDLAVEIKRLATAEAEEVNFMAASKSLSDWFDTKDSKEQRDAAALALLQNFMLITGGPGTGKTTTVAKLLGLICNNSTKLPRIALAAPTGKAAAHMARALQRALDGFGLSPSIKAHLENLEGQTVHRLLKLRPPQMRPAFNHEYPLALDVLVVDEASMLDLPLVLDLLRAVPTGCRLVLLGDENQLPSVGLGAVLAALSRPTALDKETAEKLEVYLPDHGFEIKGQPQALSQNNAKLTFSHRFGADSGIGCLARAVVSGEKQTAVEQFDKFPKELEMKSGRLKEQVALLYQKQQDYWQAVAEDNVALAYGHAADVVVLAAWRQDADDLNQAYQEYLQRQGKVSGETPWFAGQIIMITHNDYMLEVFNGDIGLIMKDEESLNGLSAYFLEKGGFKKIAISRLPDFESAFAMTVHKSQGSEYREVWLLPPSVPATTESEEEARGLDKALLYTAITRARERFVFWGNAEELCQAVGCHQKRRTALADALKWQFEQPDEQASV